MYEAGLEFFAVPNGGKRNKREARRLKEEGVREGVSDLCILTPPPASPGAPGAFLEMKRERGGVLSDEQRAFQAVAESLGWATAVAEGAYAGVAQLAAWGYPVRALPGQELP